MSSTSHLVHPSCETGEFYHVYNRGADKRKVFLETEEYRYFVHLLSTLNYARPSRNVARAYRYGIERLSLTPKTEEDLLVDVVAFCLMPNHYHLLLKQRVDGGIWRFMHKLGVGYTLFFNQRHKRSGVLFQGRFKRAHVHTDAQLRYIPHYIHMNPLPLVHKTRAGEHTSRTTAWQSLCDYEWSSLSDHADQARFPTIVRSTEIADLYGGPAAYRKDMQGLLGSDTRPTSIDLDILIDHHERV